MLNRLIQLAIRVRAIRVALNALHLRELAGWWLRHRPIIRQVPGSRLRYRIATLDGLLVAREIFAENEYSALRRFQGVRTFADLGCNCGYFSLFLASLDERTPLRGLAVDAHPDMVKGIQRNLELNQISGVHVVWGMVGAKEGEGRFYINIDAAGSSQFARTPESHVTKNPWREIVTPVVSLTETWDRLLGDEPCDVLKIDIEGSEDALLRHESAFLKRVGILVIEMHKWIVDIEALDALLSEHGLQRVEVMRSNADVQVALYVNRNGRFYQDVATLNGQAQVSDAAHA